MMRFWTTLAKTVATHGRAAAISVLSVDGSAPREAGARLVVDPAGGFHGTIGGGALEWRAIAEAQKILSRPTPSAEVTRHALGPELGQCCGGGVILLIESFDSLMFDELSALSDLEVAEPFETIGRIVDRRVHRTIVLDEKRTDRSVFGFRESFGSRRRPVWLFGAGHTGRALVLALAPLPFDVTWIDSREDAFPGVMPRNVSPVRSPDPASELAHAPDAAFILVLTHCHALDQAIVHAALTANRFAYVGLIGSATKRARFTRRLVDAGLDRGVIAEKLVCPIGLPSIRSKEPSAIAAGVAADLLIRHTALEEDALNSRAGIEEPVRDIRARASGEAQ